MTVMSPQFTMVTDQAKQKLGKAWLPSLLFILLATSLLWPLILLAMAGRKQL